MKINKKVFIRLLVFIVIIVIGMNYHSYTKGNYDHSGELLTTINDSEYKTTFNVTKYTGLDIILSFHNELNTTHTILGGYNFKDHSSINDLFNYNRIEKISFEINKTNNLEPIIYLKDEYHSIDRQYIITNEFDFNEYVQLKESDEVYSSMLQQSNELGLFTLKHKTLESFIVVKAVLR